MKSRDEDWSSEENVKIVGDGSGYEIVNENITKIGCSIFVNGANIG